MQIENLKFEDFETLIPTHVKAEKIWRKRMIYKSRINDEDFEISLIESYKKAYENGLISHPWDNDRNLGRKNDFPYYIQIYEVWIDYSIDSLIYKFEYQPCEGIYQHEQKEMVVPLELIREMRKDKYSNPNKLTIPTKDELEPIVRKYEEMDSIVDGQQLKIKDIASREFVYRGYSFKVTIDFIFFTMEEDFMKNAKYNIRVEYPDEYKNIAKLYYTVMEKAFIFNKGLYESIGNNVEMSVEYAKYSIDTWLDNIIPFTTEVFEDYMEITNLAKSNYSDREELFEKFIR